MTFFEILNTLLIEPIKLVFEIIYMLVYDVTDNPGLSIIVLSLVMNFLLLPLYKRADAIQLEERDIEEKLHKGVAHIKKTFRGDEKMMILQTYYRQNHYKPTYVLRGAISLALEIPFFMAAYAFLSKLEILQGVSFGPIADLGMPDGMLSIAGVSINILPFAMTVINMVSTVLYTKGSPLKAKLQLYIMAIVFLVLLYNSPAGLVFYWTLNNVFSLVKTIFDKMKNSNFVLAVISSVLGIGAFIYGLLFCPSFTRIKFFFLIMAFVLQIPILLFFRKKQFSKDKKIENGENKINKKLFFLSTALSTLLIGILIPSSVIVASPQEFTGTNVFYHPLWYICFSFCIAFGLFMIWTTVFFALAHEKGKKILGLLMLFFSMTALVDYMFFGKKFGLLSPTLQYENEFNVSLNAQLINIFILMAIAIVLFCFLKRWQKILYQMIFVATLALFCMAAFNVFRINQSVQRVHEQMQNSRDEMASFKFSKSEKNVLFIMLDRAYNGYIPYIMNEKPELIEKFDGFTYYSNTISFGGHTNFASPALYGGYDYMPKEINKRKNESLASKQNEALRVLPTVFSENGFEVTITDAPYVNYQMRFDPSFFYDIPNTRAYRTEGAFLDKSVQQQIISKNKRNFFCYGLMKAIPMFAQETLYDKGTYRNSNISSIEYSGQRLKNEFIGEGIDHEFMETYNVLTNLINITEIDENAKGQYISFTNDTTHKPMILKEPEYVPAQKVDNTEYEKNNQGRFTVDGVTINMENKAHFMHYDINMGALIQLANWFDYLRENGVYDNTRIIIVADHGYNLGHFDEFIFEDIDLMDNYYPLLMVKDFNSKGFHTNDEFMTNADVPALLTQDIINSPVNPFTGNSIDTERKNNEKLYIIGSHEWDIEYNNGNTFWESRWYSVHDNVRDKKNWEILEEKEVMGK